jgi:D-apionolactonase
MASYFTELNRKRPPVATIDAISCTTSPIVHAADDRSVMETHEALPSVILSMVAMAPGKTLHLGPSAIAMRHNPYGAATAANPKGERVAMAEDDPRQKGLYAAAWTVGYAATVANAGGIATLALNHLAGPSGVLGDGDKVRPVFHVMAALCQSSDAELLALELTGDQLAGLAWREDGKTRLLVANLSAEPARLAIEGTLDGQLLDATSVAAAADPAWRDSGGTALGPTIDLDAYAVLIATT